MDWRTVRFDWNAFDRTDVMIRGLRPFGLELTRGQLAIVTENHLVQWAM